MTAEVVGTSVHLSARRDKLVLAASGEAFAAGYRAEQ